MSTLHLIGDVTLGCPNFASKKVSLQSETKRNANGFASFSRNSGKKISLCFASKVSLRFVKKYVLLQSFASGTVSLQKFRFVFFLQKCLH